MQRRQFLASLAAAPLLAKEYTRAKITRIRLSKLTGHFHKFVAMNAYDKAPKGRTYEHSLIRIETDAGQEGIGAGTYAAADAAYIAAARQLLGANPFELYTIANGRVTGRAPACASLLEKYRHLDGPLFDLLGKLSNRPVWQLLGASVRDRVPVYDSTIYFSDIWFKDRGIHAVTDECREAVTAGYGAIKIKLGRGDKWMDRKVGDERDIAIVEAVREAIGPHVSLMADPNYGYRGQFDAAWQLIDKTRAANLYWMEEIFPETVENYGQLRDKMAAAGIKTLLAAGEHVRDIKAFEPYLAPRRLMDVLQMDIRQGGFLDNLQVARMAAQAGALAIQHNWASQIGNLMALHLAKVNENSPMAESDRSSSEVLITDGYRFEQGAMTIPEKPGLAISIDEQVYNRMCKPSEIIIS
jgi:D-galactarolactone cycloisomerase